MNQPSPVLPPAGAELGRPIVLCVDDDVPVLDSLARLLRDEPYDLVTTNSPRQALEWIRQRHVSVLISDQRMPEMQGTEILKATRESSPATRRIMLTGYADMDVVAEAVNQAEIQRLIPKPWNDHRLKEMIRSMVQDRRQRRESPQGSASSLSLTWGGNASPASEMGIPVLYIECAGRSVGEIVTQVAEILPPARSLSLGMRIVLADLMALDDSVQALLQQLVRVIFKSGVRVSMDLVLTKDLFGN
jgi:CheY-like chemotaxis protein